MPTLDTDLSEGLKITRNGGKLSSHGAPVRAGT
jgi:hypothetical protein